jgi:hypothetical protein
MAAVRRLLVVDTVVTAAEVAEVRNYRIFVRRKGLLSKRVDKFSYILPNVVFAESLLRRVSTHRPSR